MNLPPREFNREDYIVSTDPSRLNLSSIHKFLAEEAYWSRGILFETFLKSVENSLCFGLYHQEMQIGFARVITDYSTFAYLADVFVMEGYRRRGLGKWLIECVFSHPEVQGLRRWMLVTSNAHGLYQQYGFKKLAQPESFMEISGKDLSTDQ
jgi:GNAT superfamily N-acetyltransferase